LRQSVRTNVFRLVALSLLITVPARSEEPRKRAGSVAGMMQHMQREALRSKPDYVVYVPGSYDGSTSDSHNEHFLIFDAPDNSLMAVWTQSAGGPGRQQNRIMLSRSDDDGVSWSPPKRLVGPAGPEDPPNMASWAFPMVSKSGRIYVLYNQNQGNSGWIKMHTGTMDGVYSDDNGSTWSKPQTVPMPRSPYDDADTNIPPEWIVWQNPMRDLRGRSFVGYTRWVAEAKARYGKRELPGDWTWIESVCEFMRFENVDDDPKPEDLRLSFSAWGDKALRVPHWKDPLLSLAQEPSLVRLPDNRLFCVMRTNSGYIWYSVSDDDGYTWCNPRPLLRSDHGDPILQPVSCCPIYQLADGRYVLLHHNNRGDIGARPPNTARPRRPAFIALGEFRSGADQPMWFSESKEFIDTGGYATNGEKGDSQIGVYTSFTSRDGNNVLWYPDRKCFLLGKRITDEFLADLKVP
jgi:hypothetical protein